ncbi:ubiquitin carboxyl-terminal hydrolase [Rhizoctonia solani 123E]|uniref:ubiquitinyl hydrolase 1 n=1 Tax=Rhizoctonia solani 123E TaxID=1423351 RepID=A0A074S0N7_9AGAM|nr:ubiquitin carboxyl-terminal hydrolase [Rhizoctonia solani 123E]
MLNQLEAGDFDHISDQIIEWVNKTSGWEGDGQALMRTIKLIYERARENEAFGEMYARLCRKIMERASPTIQDEAIKNWEGQPIIGEMLFRKYLLRQCQEGFECRWSVKGAANDKAKRQGLGLVRFIGELFKLSMLTERIVHECIKQLLSNVVGPEEEEIESLCKFLTTVGQSLDNPKARNHMDIYFERMQDMARNRNISPQMQFMLLEVIELRARHWQKCLEDLAPFGMIEDEAWDKAVKGVEEYLDDQNIDKALIALEALPSEQRHLFVDRLANAAMYGGNNVVVLAKNLLSIARTRSVISPEPFEHGIIPSIAFGSAKSQSLRPLAMPTTRPDPPKSDKLPKPDLPITNTITAKTLKSYLATALQILVLDVRPRDQVDSRRIPVDNVVCIEPIVLGRKGMSAKELQEALIISSKTERTLFEKRNTFDLVVLTDTASTEFKDPTTPLNLLFRIIYETEFLKPLRRSPVFLYGGIKAWADEIGEFRGEGVVVTPSVDVGKVWTRKPAVSGRLTAGRMSQDAGPPGSSFGAVRKPFTYHERSVSPPTSSGTPTYSQRSLEHMMSPPSPVSAAGYFEHPRHAYSGSVTLSTTRPASLDYPNLIRPPRTAASPAIGRVDSRPRIPQAPHFKPDYSVVYWRDEQLGMSGLRNMGNTGYMNSVLQCLSGTVPLTRFFTDRRWHHEVNMMNPLGTRGELANAFYALLRDMWQGDLPYLTPVPFRKSICAHARQFAGSEQHDAQEFLLFLLDGLHEDLNRIIVKPQFEELTPEREAELERMPKQLAGAHEWARYKRRNDSIVVDYFQGQFCNQMQCLTCGQTSTTYNAFLNLSVPIPAAKGVTRLPLDECIKALVGREVMDNEDAWHCPRCKTARRAAKQLTFSRMPPVLIIHLKRFSFKGPFTDKLETLVEFPLKDLDLTNYMPPPLTPNMDKDGLERFSPQDPRAQIPPYKYELYGVANHFGSLSSGHYTAFVKSRGKWMYCDDSRITPAEPKEVVGKPAYILFYKRVPPDNK